MKTVSDIESIKDQLISVFPDAVRGSVSKSNWGKGRKMLHLHYWIGSDTVGGYIIQAKGDLFYFIEWDTNSGNNYLFAESEIVDMVNRVTAMFDNKIYRIERIVGQKDE